jgi:antitoxin component of MazEF toxin-antitoxin module
MEVETELKKWGSSLGIVIPKSVVEEGKMKEGQKIRVFISKPVDRKKAEQIKSDWEKLRKEVSAKWKGPSAVEEIRDQRTKKW